MSPRQVKAIALAIVLAWSASGCDDSWRGVASLDEREYEIYRTAVAQLCASASCEFLVLEPWVIDSESRHVDREALKAGIAAGDLVIELKDQLIGHFEDPLAYYIDRYIELPGKFAVMDGPDAYDSRGDCALLSDWYPGADGRVGFSRVAFDSESRLAMTIVSLTCSESLATGTWLVAFEKSDGEWREISRTDL